MILRKDFVKYFVVALGGLITYFSMRVFPFFLKKRGREGGFGFKNVLNSLAQASSGLLFIKHVTLPEVGRLANWR